MILSGRYTIINKSNGLVLQSSPPAHASQLSLKHPRVPMVVPAQSSSSSTSFDYPLPPPPPHPTPLTNTSQDSTWIIESLGNRRFLIRNHDNWALDSNEQIPQQDKRHPMPSLSRAESRAMNQRWIIELATSHNSGLDQSLYSFGRSSGSLSGGGGAPPPPPPSSDDDDTFYIISELSGKALDGNIDAAQQTDPAFKSPFLWPLHRHARNHEWRIVRTENYFRGGPDIAAPVPPNTQYESGGSFDKDWSSGGSYDQP